MKTIEGIRRSGVAIGPERSIREAACVMEESGVGALVILDVDRIVGIVTDRDLVRRGLAKGLDLEARVDAVMSAPVVTIDANADLRDSFALFRENALRRLVVTRDRHFVGMITADDLLVNLAADLSDLTRPITAEILFAHRDVPVVAVR
ncbi:MAG TPA: CBS domain-containing protein [Acidimicrobiales bacterium]|nr:CBS domain-containing protein [Acidimicrobiales bacterium]